MTNYDVYYREIERKKGDIINALVKALADGNKEKEEKYRLHVEHMILQKTKVFFLEVKSFQSAYMQDLIKSLEEIDEIADVKASYYVLNSGKLLIPLTSFDKEKEKKYPLYKEYQKKEKLYWRFGIHFSDFLNVYEKKDINGIKKLDELLKIASNKLFMKDAKDYFSSMKDLLSLGTFHYKFDKLYKNYKLKGYDDLFTLHSEVNSFLIDTSMLSEEEIKIVNRNKIKFAKRIGKEKKFNLEKRKALKLKKIIEKIYNYNLYKNVFVNTNLKDLFKNNEAEYTEENLKNGFAIVLKLLSASGLCSDCEFGGKRNKYCTFPSSIISDCQEWKNSCFMHEFAHSIDNVVNFDASFNRKYHYLNETLTQYLALTSVKYLNGNILDNCPVSYRTSSNESIYDVMLPLVDILKESEIWDDILEAKVFGDMPELWSKIGKDNMKKISKCFDKVFSLKDSKEGCEKLKKIVESIKQDVRK